MSLNLRYLAPLDWPNPACTASIVKHSWLLINTKSSPTYLPPPCRIPPAIHHCRATQVATLQFSLNASLLFIYCFRLPFVCRGNRFQRKQPQSSISFIYLLFWYAGFNQVAFTWPTLSLVLHLPPIINKPPLVRNSQPAGPSLSLLQSDCAEPGGSHASPGYLPVARGRQILEAVRATDPAESHWLPKKDGWGFWFQRRGGTECRSAKNLPPFIAKVFVQ